jgi:RNA polymerase sigma-70 factor (family 1)
LLFLYQLIAVSIKPLYTETELLTQTAEGNESAFAQLFYEFHQELGDYVFRLTKSLPLTEEIIQDVFIKIWSQKEQLNKIVHFRAYLFTVARNYTLNEMRNEARKALLHQEWVTNFAENTEYETTFDQEKYFILIDQAVASLPPQQQKAWLMSRKEGLKHEEIAVRLQLSKETVKRHITLAMAFISSYVKSRVGNVLHVLCIIKLLFF